ncbi:MAG: phosphatidic acid phosphatase [Clostridiales bacterium]|nr:phosphatidic acid phosphatase [Clostridiales bacterium]
MKRPVVDYRELRPSTLNEPRYSHLKLLAGWIVYFALYFLTENLIPYKNCHVIHCALDDVIPFNEFFLLFYCYWYGLIVYSLLWFLLYDIRAFKRLQIYIMITQAVAMIAYISWPSVQHLRPEAFTRDNLLTKLMTLIYAFDTPTGVCPSLHVAYSVAIASVWCHQRDVTAHRKAFMVASAVLISISTAFVKQHSVVDIFAALPVCALGEYLVFGDTKVRRWIEESQE